MTFRAVSKEKYWVAKDVIPENSVAQQWVVLQRDLERVYEKKPGLDLDKVIRGLKRRASDSDRKSLIGRCARYVGFALVDGGLPYAGLNAHQYNPYLVKHGFKEISTTDYQIGDIVVVEAFKWGKKSHPHGHIQMYAVDNQWISDFFQTDFWAGGDYRNATPNYKIYRWE